MIGPPANRKSRTAPNDFDRPGGCRPGERRLAYSGTLMMTRLRRILAEIAADPVHGLKLAGDGVEPALIRRRARSSLGRLPTPRQPYSPVDEKIMAIHWVHRIALPDGRVTPGDWDTDTAMRRLRLPEDLSGKTVLDVGA